MESLEEVKNLEKKINEYVKTIGASLGKSELHLLEILPKLLDYFYFIIEKNIYQERDDLSTLKHKILEYLKSQEYSKKEFRILEVELFDDSQKYLSTLIENFYFYFENYKLDINYRNMYYYAFHLIYYILFIIVNSFDKILFEDKNIKFYLYHIIHFFEKDKNSPEYFYFFYEGAFKFLSKKYGINIKYLFSLDKSVIEIFSDDKKINSIKKEFYNEMVMNTNKSDVEYNFISKFNDINKEIMEIFFTDNFVANDLQSACEDLKNKIKKINEIFSKNNVQCKKLKKYEEKIDELYKIISDYNLTDNHFALMSENFKCNDTYVRNIETLLINAKEWIKCNDELNEDYTQIFSQIINSTYFKDLYLTAMKSSYVENFVNVNELKDNYNFFINTYAKEINKYILYVPLTRGIQAYVSNYFRIALNLNSIELIGNFDDEKQKIEVYQSYLLVQLLHESFHFIYRLDKKNKSCLKALSPEKLKIHQTYREIGVDLIFHIFGTEYITYFSLDNCKLINNLDSWKNKGTNFKVFNMVYLQGEELKGKDEIKFVGLGLKCNISFYEGKRNDSKICTDASIRYCF